jgi:hypothetical protein
MDYVKMDNISYDKIPEKDEDLFYVLQNILKDLPIECQIEEQDFQKTCINLYRYFLNHETICMLPEPFFSDYINVYAIKVFRQIARGQVINQIKDTVKTIY